MVIYGAHTYLYIYIYIIFTVLANLTLWVLVAYVGALSNDLHLKHYVQL
jgi:hypothetical protein